MSGRTISFHNKKIIINQQINFHSMFSRSQVAVKYIGPSDKSSKIWISPGKSGIDPEKKSNFCINFIANVWWWGSLRCKMSSEKFVIFADDYSHSKTCSYKETDYFTQLSPRSKGLGRAITVPYCNKIYLGKLNNGRQLHPKT